jgi:uncharacterized protein (TIGR02598 family)
MHSPALPSKRAAFSLVEVALAIAIVSFAVIGILSLMSTGLGNYRQVMDTTICAQIAQRIINDAQQADFKVLTDYTKLQAVAEANQADPLYSFRAPTIAQPALRYFDEQGNEIVLQSGATLSPAQRTQAVYWVNTRITPRPTVPSDNDEKQKQVGMDGLPAVKGSKVESPMAQLTVEVACNPNAINLTFVTDKGLPLYNLYDLTKIPGVRVLTYSAYVGRN